MEALHFTKIIERLTEAKCKVGEMRVSLQAFKEQYEVKIQNPMHRAYVLSKDFS